MEWPRFLVWNALGGICWAATVGFGAYFIGHAFEKVIGVGGFVAVGLVSAVLFAAVIARTLRDRRARGEPTPEE
jgi:membrane protein DedA with SNARE-associated domain